MHILLITRHYPPEISGGARRPFLYTQALRSLGHRVTTVTPFKTDDDDNITITNKAIARGIETLHNGPSGHSQGATDPIKNILRRWARWPDDNRPWARNVIHALKQTDLKPDWIMTTSPPESTHSVGAALSRHLDVPWIAELRDTWIEHPHREILAQSKIRRAIEKRMAKTILSSAKAITAVSETVMREARLYAPPNIPECIISHFSDPPPDPFAFNQDTLNFVHTGGFTLSDRRRNLAPLIEALEKVQTRRKNLVLHIAGPLSVDEIKLAKASTVTTELHGSVTLSQARAMQAGADALLLCTPENSHALPGKHAEYVASGKPILYLGCGDWLNLVESTHGLEPIATGALKIKKDRNTLPREGLTHIEAAQKLIEFLNAQ